MLLSLRDSWICETQITSCCAPFAMTSRDYFPLATQVRAIRSACTLTEAAVAPSPGLETGAA
jgi:hypothetical protein